jgi:hypothetical protein
MSAEALRAIRHCCRCLEPCATSERCAVPANPSGASTLVYGVTLTKTAHGFGAAERGSKFRAVFRQGYAPDEAVRRALRVLKRDRPSENPCAWIVSDDDGGCHVE